MSSPASPLWEDPENNGVAEAFVKTFSATTSASAPSRMPGALQPFRTGWMIKTRSTPTRPRLPLTAKYIRAQLQPARVRSDEGDCRRLWSRALWAALLDFAGSSIPSDSREFLIFFGRDDG